MDPSPIEARAQVGRPLASVRRQPVCNCSCGSCVLGPARPADLRGPADVYVSEADALRALVRLYGWAWLGEGKLARYRK